MKLNSKRTILVGFAFFLICAFWQVYDVTIAMTLTSKFGLSQTASGMVMALDNILALFLLPLFGTLSDKHKGKAGRRTPFIRFGTIVAAIALIGLSFVDNMQLNLVRDVSVVDDPAALEIISKRIGKDWVEGAVKAADEAAKKVAGKEQALMDECIRQAQEMVKAARAK